MKIYKRYGLALNAEEKEKFEKVKNHYNKGVKKIFMSMVDAMYRKIETLHPIEPESLIPLKDKTLPVIEPKTLPAVELESLGDGVNKSGIMRNFPGDERNITEETE